MPNIDDFKDDPPTPHKCMLHGELVPIISRCDIHKDSHDECYRCHLDKDHRPEEDVFYKNMPYKRPDNKVTLEA